MAYESLAVITSAVSRITNGQIGVCRQVIFVFNGSCFPTLYINTKQSLLDYRVA